MAELTPTVLKPAAPPPAPTGRDEDDAVERRTLRDYYIILRERIWIALPLALLVSVTWGYFKMRETPMYAAEAKLQFEKPETVVTTQGVVDPNVRSEIDINTNIGILSSRKIRNQVVESLSPDEKGKLLAPFLKQKAAGQAQSAPSIENALGNVGFEVVRNSYLIKINVTHLDPDAAVIVANRYLDQFMRYQLYEQSSTNSDAVKALTEQAERLRKDSEAAEDKLQDYMKKNNLVSLEKGLDLITERMQLIGRRRTEQALLVLNSENALGLVKEQRTNQKDLLEINAIATYGQVSSLKARLLDQQAEQERLAEKYFERHPKMIDIANAIAITQDQLDKAINLAIADLEARLVAQRRELTTYEEQYKQAETEFFGLRDRGVEFTSLQNEASVKRSNYGSILERLNQANITRNVNEKVSMHILDRAVPNYGQVSPNRERIIRTGIGIGVLIFVGVAVGLSFIDDRIKSAWDVESFIGVNLLGIIPDLSTLKDDDKYALLLDNKQVPGTEAFLSVYSSAKIHSKLDFPKSMLITSTIPGEGKTLISCNLAGCFARHGKKTLIVDCDLRRPMLHRHFKQQNSAGLISWFESGASLDGDLTTNPTLGITKVSENLSLLSSGGRSKSPTELLENPVFGQLLERLKREYDLVIVDSPPMGAVTDSLLIAERIDEVVYVCRFNRAYRKHIRLYIKALKGGKNEILGIVLNGLSPRRIEYYSNYRYYRSYKKYYGAQS